MAATKARKARVPCLEQLDLPHDRIGDALDGLEHFEEFAGRLTTKEGQTLKIEPFQRMILLPYFAGVTETLILIPKKNGKTCLMAAVADHHVDTTDSPEAYIGASSVAQAKKMYNEASRFARQVGLLPYPGYNEIRKEKAADAGNLQVLASDKLASEEEGSGSLEGIGPTLGLVDELHAHKNMALYAAIQGGLPGSDGQMFTISTAGKDDETPLGQMRLQALELPDKFVDGFLTIVRSDDFVMFEWAVPPRINGVATDLSDLSIIKKANPASFQTKEKLKRLHKSPSMRTGRWARYHANQWRGDAEDNWLAPNVDAWTECEEVEAEIPDGEPVYIGADVGLKKDTAAIVTCWRREDGKVVAQADVFVPPKDEALDLSKLEQAIRDLADRYEVMGVAYDPWTFERSAQMLGDEGLLMIEFPMRNERTVPASARLYEAVVEKRIVHDGDPVFAAHVNAGATRDTDRGWRLSKKSKKPIDALMALLIVFPSVDQTSTGGFEW